MLSVLYIPVVIYQIIRDYLYTPTKRTSSVGPTSHHESTNKLSGSVWQSTPSQETIEEDEGEVVEVQGEVTTYLLKPPSDRDKPPALITMSGSDTDDEEMDFLLPDRVVKQLAASNYTIPPAIPPPLGGVVTRDIDVVTRDIDNVIIPNIKRHPGPRATTSAPVSTFLNHNPPPHNCNVANAEEQSSTLYQDEPMPTSFLTSCKDAPIVRDAAKSVSTTRKRSDAEWTSYMRKCMLNGEKTKILKKLKECYQGSYDAYQLCCDLIVTFGVTHGSGRTTFQRAAIAELTRWKSTSRKDVPLLTHKMKALDVSFLCNTSLFEGLREVYEFQSLPHIEVVNFINDKLERKRQKYIKHMAFIISELQLQAHFVTRDILFPLLSMDKMMTIENYIVPVEVTKQFIKCLDDLIEPTGHVVENLIEELTTQYNYNRNKAQFRFSQDQIITLIKRLAKKHGLPPSDFPNVMITKTIGNLKSIMYCKYKRNGDGDWTDAILETVENSEILQRALFNELMVYNDYKYAAYLFRKLSCSESLLPPKLLSYVQTQSTAASSSVDNESRSSEFEIPEEVDISWEEYSKINDRKEDIIPSDPDVINSTLVMPTNVKIFDINCLETLVSCQKVLSQVNVIGLDSEWRTVIDPTKAISISILQLACYDKVFLIDIPAIVSEVSESDIKSFVGDVFDDQVVVGYALDQDIQHLIESCPYLGHHLEDYHNITDLSVAHKHITVSEREKRAREIRAALGKGLPVPEAEDVSELTGLARLCEITFHAYLDKSCQISNWNRRPLTPEQREYAALDAYVLLPLYYNLKGRFKSLQNLEADTNISAINSEINSLSYIGQAEDCIQASSLKLVVDIPLQGLGKKLRHIGVDAAILSNEQCVDDAVQISRSEGRIVLSKDSNADRIVRHLDPGRVYRVRSQAVSDQLAEIISHFKLEITDQDFFSRCAICNCSIFAKLPCDVAKRMLSYEIEETVSREVATLALFNRRLDYVGDLDVDISGHTVDGVKFQIDQIRPKRFEEVSEFWGCTECGKIYWDGCHMRKFREKHGI